MKLLFDLNSLRPPRSGIGYYTQHLLEGLRTRSDVEDVAGWMVSEIFQGEKLLRLVNGEIAPPVMPGAANGASRSLMSSLRRLPVLQPLRTAMHRRASRALRDDFAQRGYVYHETNFIASQYRGPTVVTIHDLSHRRHPEFHQKVAVDHLDRGLPRTLKQARKIIVDSEYTKKELLALYDVPEDKVVTIYLGVDASFRPYAAPECTPTLERLGLRRDGFVLSVCTLQPRKNLSRLVEAFGRLPASVRRELPLVLIGADGWKNSELLSLVEPMIAAREIIVPGYLPRADLLHLYASATVFAYPSLYEGFGLPVAEAMASGTAVLTSNVTSIPEVAGGAALEVDPFSVDAITEGLETLLSNASLRAELAAKGLRRAAELTWDSTIQQTCDVYRALAG
jgi:alpha-1,3-rhamnosyl/mannosyltransferase